MSGFLEFVFCNAGMGLRRNVAIPLGQDCITQRRWCRKTGETFAPLKFRPYRDLEIIGGGSAQGAATGLSSYATLVLEGR
jgi:hypothetical protein